ncbi:hypothetical protein OV079_09085 [Nannocystis pusilla]|uniref:Uncharacterized protein n=1 Tax=Nannocystis pusilla TaxID=889268 RepID=A0A9X3IWP6_9BACT|nr:hypothetical protein [Nannocystis pusilla]MCY1005714.1 hypothetical protein [Nannocystis pusilla]
MMDARLGQGFGWAVACPATAEDAAARHVEGLWASFFPAAAGYAVTRSEVVSVPEPSPSRGRAHQPGMRLQVRRGDFCGEVEVAATTGPRRSRLWLRGYAGSQRLAAVELRAARATDRLRLAGSLVGASALLALCVELLTHPPGFTVDMMFFLGGLLVAVIMVVGLAIGANVGSWFGERQAVLGWVRALALVERDTALREDLRRWRSLVKNLAHYRDALAGSSRRQPFRALSPGAEDDEELAEETGAPQASAG